MRMFLRVPVLFQSWKNSSEVGNAFFSALNALQKTASWLPRIAEIENSEPGCLVSVAICQADGSHWHSYYLSGVSSPKSVHLNNPETIEKILIKKHSSIQNWNLFGNKVHTFKSFNSSGASYQEALCIFSCCCSIIWLILYSRIFHVVEGRREAVLRGGFSRFRPSNILPFPF